MELVVAFQEFIPRWQIMKNGSGSVLGLFVGINSSLYGTTRESETINWTPHVTNSKESRFGRRIDPVLNTFENRLSQVKILEFWI